jgi:hypothetical protein
MKLRQIMKLRSKTLAIIIAAAFVLLIPVIVFFVRSPVLIVTDQAFIMLYGEERIRSEQRNSSISLFRRVKTVAVTNEAADDIVKIAISDVSSRPFCVIFPLRFARAARLYREENMQIPVILLEGRNSNERYLSVLGDVNDYFIYQTDVDSDFYKAGITAAAFNTAENGRIAVFLDSGILAQAGDAFLRGINSLENPPGASFYTSVSENIENPDIFCVVIAGAGVEYFDREMETKKPVILFTWVAPLFLPDDVVLIINDSPWVQSVQAVRMAAARAADGKIKSKFQIINKKNIGRETLRKIKK